ncbi:hypothetical protein [Lysobacter panacisoli]|uniref:DUF2306 domain-containing protein n=1 Tax=Lysobacter panacisoli TaxID=1255263 RepID=A0ABP9L0R1_9GAMM|nr:hypothetical protein [Lysobacter panacisoli]
MSAYKLLVVVHVLVGAVALVTFWTAAWLRKGTPAHRTTGRVYLLAMLGIVVTGAPMAIVRVVDGHPVTGAFLGYLVVITATGVWTSWRAVRDKAAPVRFAGPVYVALAVSSLLAGAGVLALGVRVGAPLLMGFSAVGLLTGADMLRRRRRYVRNEAPPRWWMVEHYTAMIGNGIATHIAFLGIGLPRLLPGVDGSVLHYLAWFGPLGAAVVAKVLLDRRWKPKTPSAPSVPSPARARVA